jgi:glycosyltransferase involved in cell wall biosynthesis
MSTHVILTIASLDREGGATSFAVAAMARHLAARGCSATVVSFNSEQPLLAAGQGEAGEPAVRLVPRAEGGLYLWDDLTRYGRALREEIDEREAVVVHDNGLWLPVNHRVARVAQEEDCPRIVSPHGMLEPWSLNEGRWKKKAAWWLYQKTDLKSASALVATAGQEAEHIRDLGIDRPVATIPNGVDMPEDLPSLKISETSSRRTVLFLSRIHKKKGLLNLVEAWNRLRPNGWRVAIAGPGENGHEAEVRRRISERGVGDDFVFVGPVKGTEKWNLYRRADLFVLPTHSENFGIVVAEALACGIPVITTRGAPWSDLVDHECGWWIDVGADPLVEALGEATSMSAAERAAMGRRGRELVEQKYTWPRVAEALKSVYAWVAGKQRRPECVFTPFGSTR